MKVKELIEELKKVDPETELTFNIKVASKSYGYQVSNGVWFNQSYTGATLSIPLKGNAFISKWPKDKHGNNL